MPRYSWQKPRWQSYECPKCGDGWEAAVGVGGQEDPDICPECGARGYEVGRARYEPEPRNVESEESKMAGTSKDTNIEGILEAALNGETTLRELIDLVDADPELGEEFGRNGNAADPAELAMRDHVRREKARRAKGSCPVPGKKARSRGRGRGLGRGMGQGPMGVPGLENAPAPEEPVEETEETEQALPYELSQLTSFGDFISATEACPFAKKTKKGKKKKKKESIEEGIHEFAAPERQDVIRWGRGSGAKRTNQKLPFYFAENAMYSRNKKIAERDLEHKKARVLSPGVLDATSGRHAVLCQKGLSYCGYEIEMVESLEVQE